MSRDLIAELKLMHEANPACGICYNGKTAQEWHSEYWNEYYLNSRIKDAIAKAAIGTALSSEQVIEYIETICQLIR